LKSDKWAKKTVSRGRNAATAVLEGLCKARIPNQIAQAIIAEAMTVSKNRFIKIK